MMARTRKLCDITWAQYQYYVTLHYIKNLQCASYKNVQTLITSSN